MKCDYEECVDNLFDECTYTNLMLHKLGFKPCKFEEDTVTLTREEYEQLLYLAESNGNVILEE